MFDMWSSVTSKLEAHANTLGQTNVQSPGQNNSSGSIKGKFYTNIHKNKIMGYNFYMYIIKKIFINQNEIFFKLYITRYFEYLH